MVHKPTLLFDLDGTLSDPRVGITRSIVYALNQLGRIAPDVSELNWCIGPPLHQSFEKLLGGNELVSQAVVHYRERYIEVGMFENELYDKIAETLSALKTSNHRMLVVTSKYNQIAEKIIKRFDLDSYFDAIYGSEEDGSRSDKTELIKFVLAEEHLLAETCIMIGDREHDMIGAKNNNVRGIGVGWGYGTHEELVSAGARTIVVRPHDLHQAIEV